MAPSRPLGLLVLSVALMSSLAPLASAADHTGGPSLYRNFYEAIDQYSQNHDGELSALKEFLDAEPFADGKKTLMAESNGTLFAPKNDAFVNAGLAIGYGSNGEKPLSVADMLSIDSLREATVESLSLHFVDGPYDSGVMHHEWWLTEAENTSATTSLGEELYLWSNGNNADKDDLKIFYDQSYTDLAATVVAEDIARTDDPDFPAGHEGHVHTIDTLMMSPSMKRLANTGVGFNFEDEIDAEQDLHTVKAVIMTSDVAKFAVLGPGLTGAVLAPTDAAFNTFIEDMNLNVTKFLADTDRVKRVLYEHIVPTISSPNEETTTMEYDTLKDGSEGGVTLSVEFVGGNVTKVTNDGESVEVIQGGCNFQGGCMYKIGKVLISKATKDFVMSRSSTANGKWKEAALLPEGVATADANAAEDLLAKAGLSDLLNDETNTEKFTMFLPGKEKARQDIFDQLGVDTLSEVSVGKDELKKLLDSYRVPASNYDGDKLTEGGSPYQTANPKVKLSMTDNGIAVEDVETGRKLLAKVSATGRSSPMEFENGKVVYFMDNLPVTKKMAFDALTGGASQFTPSIFTIAFMVIAAMVAQLSL
ncbi:hypothetical protein DUNSADRAFT_18672 [Dunaliella salina]|uniref:FAS1 domain-containing protein n=1 Tax=Dunaliella salina TaxID=3046 RepID=A0ABQ7GYZ7_DUNSA|nr:hypothetical protein DUNSADRAFT_18672 [Dunaliella salina]|eukprot:KAF5839794.1 hypothetical protein DUNSADRAFT_18672 [Dunaliella salina]